MYLDFSDAMAVATSSGRPIGLPSRPIPTNKILRLLNQTYSVRELIQGLPRQLIPLRILESDAVKPVRAEYNRDYRAKFKAAAHAELFSRFDSNSPQKLLLEAIEDFDIHHKYPVILGGDNHFDRLVLIDRELHDGIHAEIGALITRVQRIRERHQETKKRQFKTLEHELNEVENVHIDEKGEIFIAIPWPQGKVCIPQLLARGRRRPSLHTYEA